MAQPAPPGPIKIPDAPLLPYHFGPRPAPPNGEKFGNIAAVGLMPNGDLLVFNRNPAIMMVEYDPGGTTVKRVFAPKIATSPHGMRIDRHGNIWAIDSFMNVIYKMNANGDVLKMFGTYGENGPWDNSKWNGMFGKPADIAFDNDDSYLCGAEPAYHYRLHLLLSPMPGPARPEIGASRCRITGPSGEPARDEVRQGRASPGVRQPK